MDGRPVAIFDGVCNLCNAAVDWIIRHDRRARIVFAASQSPPGAALLARHGASPSAADTFVLVEHGRLYDRSTAALHVARLVGFPWSLAAVFLVVPRPLRDAIYSYVARNRYRWFGRKETCRLPSPEERARFLD
jgi:predicted DCC family thiol-disulfide oxidoreductase YuxK